MSAIAISHPIQTAPPAALSERYLLTQVGPKTLVIPAVWVAEIVRLERSKILALPIYSPLLAGVVHQNGGIVPLISTCRLLQLELSPLRELFMMVRLSAAAGSLANSGLTIDSALGTKTRSELPPALFEPASDSDANAVLLNQDWFNPALWQPQRWQ
jgi:chemotaxis signal transduction protein